MSDVYLRGDVQVEPLVDHWYAWSHLIPPATRCRNLKKRYIPILESYIAAPTIHASAIRDPKMRGGPFVDYDGKRVNEISALLERTKSTRADLLALSDAFDDLDRLLSAEARGASMQELYPRVPDRLRGYVELVYDLNNHPSLRLIEPLFYRNRNGWHDGQTVALSITSGDERPFILSTPRLRLPGLLELDLPFKAEALDFLFATKHAAQPFTEVCERCGVSGDDTALFRTFFTTEPPRRYSRYTGRGVRWRYFGHACILLETPKTSVLFDPVLSYTYETTVSRYTYEDLPDHIDFAVITHNHQDHVLLETLLQLRHKIGTVVVPRGGTGSIQDPSLALTLAAIGFRNVVELREFESIPLDRGTLMGLPFLGEHADLNVPTKLAYAVEVDGQRLMFAADSCNIEPLLYEHVRKELGAVRTLFVGMECEGAPGSWIDGALRTGRLERSHDESRRLNGSDFRQATGIVDVLDCREVFVYAMGMEPWFNHVIGLQYTPESKPIVESDRFIACCRERGLVAERLFAEREMLLD